MKPTLSVYALPRLVEPEELAGGAAVVIDVLRAATTIAYALAAGAAQIIPCREISDALALADRFPPDEIVLGGERNGLPIDGFQLGNSPEEYSADRVAGKTVIFTTTNGTRAMAHARAADEVLVAAFVDAVGSRGPAVGSGKDQHPLCRHRGAYQRGRRSVGGHVGRSASTSGGHCLPAKRPGDYRPRILAQLVCLPAWDRSNLPERPEGCLGPAGRPPAEESWGTEPDRPGAGRRHSGCRPDRSVRPRARDWIRRRFGFGQREIEQERTEGTEFWDGVSPLSPAPCRL